MIVLDFSASKKATRVDTMQNISLFGCILGAPCFGNFDHGQRQGHCFPRPVLDCVKIDLDHLSFANLFVYSAKVVYGLPKLIGRRLLKT
jgi:hypothetical protein